MPGKVSQRLDLCEFSLIRDVRTAMHLPNRKRHRGRARNGLVDTVERSLLDAAERGFDLLITTDQALRTQQNLSGRKLAILVLPFASWPKLKRNVQKIASHVKGMRAGDYLAIGLSAD